MARIRSVHPDICRDETLAECSASAERTFVRLWCHLDDEGRTLDNPRLILADLYPLHDDVDLNSLDDDLDELAALGLLIRYENAGKRYLSAKPETWKTYQKPRHPSPSKYPAPDAPDSTVTAECGNVTAFRRKAPAGVGVGVGVGGGVGDGADPAPASPPRKKARPKDWSPNAAHATKASDAGVDLSFEAQQFMDYHDAKGSKFVDWDKAFHTWLGNAKKFKRERAQASGQGAPRW